MSLLVWAYLRRGSEEAQPGPDGGEHVAPPEGVVAPSSNG
jgi:hypothetical protein